MRATAILSTSILLLAAAVAGAQDNQSSGYYSIGQLVFFSKTEPVHPNWAGFVEVRFDSPVTWVLATSCSRSAVAIRAEDTHLMAGMQTALALNRSVRLFIEDSQVIDGVCILRAVQY